ncbi:MAG TPA: hypothetical protein VM243_18315 [Phycisphaerae bacterium]|nr:hypothetical protein [Phycisphaerae bacterium]
MATAPRGNNAILLRLRHRERLFRVKVTAMVLFGLPLSLVGPFVLATIFWLAGRALGLLSWDRFWGQWMWLFLALVSIVIPLLYRLELRTAGGYLSEAAKDFNPHGPTGAPFLPGSAAYVGAVAAVVANPRAVSAGIVEVFLFGPRLVVGACQQIRAARHLKQANVELAAAILAVLLARDTGIDTHRFLKTGQKLEHLLPTLAYLTFHRWIGVRDDWQQVYVYSASRETLRSASGQARNT